METHELDYKGIKLVITGTYYKGGWNDWETPPDAQEFEIDSIEANGLDLMELLEDETHNLENQILETYY